ncbi:MAG: hypothetical protein JO122_18110, partial [Acetobacteraceae bacterium]|nr:hypothetical protein [Acetobacteraceae bacterium]
MPIVLRAWDQRPAECHSRADGEISRDEDYGVTDKERVETLKTDIKSALTPKSMIVETGFRL